MQKVEGSSPFIRLPCATRGQPENRQVWVPASPDDGT